MINDTSVSSILREHLERIANADNTAENDYYREGILYCGTCNKPKQAWIDWIPDADGNREQRLVPIMCDCSEAELKAIEREAEKGRFIQRLNNLRDAINGGSLTFPQFTFKDDKNATSSLAVMCRKYVNRWNEMKAGNMGILLYGNKGTGKTFYASCIANALADRNVTTAFTTTANLMSVLSSRDKVEAIQAISNVQLLVLDDLDAERDTSYGAELMYTIVDTRYRSRKPTIVTTNLDLADMKVEKEKWRSRIYDRVIEMCPIAVKVVGDSKRNNIADERKAKARELLRQTMREIAYGD